ncbi:MAG TPA: GNAT family N-acetyltransferase [Motilibacteraceae bacterium]|nr:GNAT family N-acetyltransferase [Motilibacteraceae bacterium]
MSDPPPALPPTDHAGLRRHRLRWLSQPWDLVLPGQDLRVRGARTADVDALLLMHGRCSPATLSRRYRTPDPRPPRALLRRLVTAELPLVAVAAPNRVVALATLTPMDDRTVHLGLLVEDAFQRRGIGRALAAHSAAAARLLGYRHLHASVAAGDGWAEKTLLRLGIAAVERDDEDEVVATLGLGALAGLAEPGSSLRPGDGTVRPAGTR